MINFEEKTITIPAGAELTGTQVFQLTEQKIKESHLAENGKLTEGLDYPYEIQTVKLGDKTGTEGINVANSIVLLQRLQLKESWRIVEDKPAEKPAEAVQTEE